jgi:O-acetyl-ADP-ribose deacetylase (regulator of RNase III)
MITYVACDLFQSPARVLVNTVNTVGVMGKGIAKEFKRIYPEMFREYQQICEKGTFDIGNLWVYKTTNKWVLNFPTKSHWRQPSRPEYIEAGLKKFAETYHVYGITSISFPMLGCGNGELDWETQVQPLMEQYLERLPVSAFVHHVGPPGSFVPEHRDAKAVRKWLRDEPESLAFAEVWDDLRSELVNGAELTDVTNGQSFNARVTDDTPAVILDTGHEIREIPADAIRELWQQVRGAGFVSGLDFPSGVDSNSNFIVPMMAKLPYVEPVVMECGYGSSPTRTTGLRLAPRSRPAKPPTRRRQAQLPLLASTGPVERE